MIVGICGVAGSGKDTAADFLVANNGFIKVAFADLMKRICRDVFDFSDEQLWGPSEKRNEEDQRYFREVQGGGSDGWDQDRPRNVYLTPRYALQQLGTEWGRNCYQDIWAEYAVRTAKKLLTSSSIFYTPQHGIRSRCVGDPEILGVVISDVRYSNEIDVIKQAGGKVIRVLRGRGLTGDAGRHTSETSQTRIPNFVFDLIADNREWSLDQLRDFMVSNVGQWQLQAAHPSFNSEQT